MKHIVTSGCSFSEKGEHTWPYHLTRLIDTKVYTSGLSSAGNSWIAKTAIHQTQLLLDDGISPTDITVIVMWSGIDRKDLFVSAKETANFHKLVLPGSGRSAAINPVNFLGTKPDETYAHSTVDGYLLGSISASFLNNHIQNVKKDLIMPFFSNESLAIESYENFLRLQWYCQSKNIKLLNLTFLDIMHYPSGIFDFDNRVLTKDLYRNITPLYNMIDFDNWLFWKDTGGMYEYTRDNKLAFNADKQHPAAASHEYFVDNFLIPELTDRGYV